MKLKIYSLLLVIAVTIFCQVSHASSPEQRLLLAYIYNLAKFIEWPENAIEKNAPIELCFYGNLGDLAGMTNTLDNKTISNHTIQTQEISRGGELGRCHVVFISDSEQIYLRPLLDKLQTGPVLTISDSDAFMRADGMIALVYSDGKLRFDINKKRVEASGLTVSSQILRLARKVIE